MKLRHLTAVAAMAASVAVLPVSAAPVKANHIVVKKVAAMRTDASHGRGGSLLLLLLAAAAAAAAIVAVSSSSGANSP